MLTFPQILIGIFTAAGVLLTVILLVVLLPRRDGREAPRDQETYDPLHRVNGRNGEGSPL